MLKKRKEEKPIKRKSIYLKYGFVITEHESHYCPRCNHILNAGSNYQPKYCDQCGQKISFTGIIWKEDKELGLMQRGDFYEPVKNSLKKFFSSISAPGAIPGVGRTTVDKIIKFAEEGGYLE